MAFNESLADRIRGILNNKHVTFDEKKMMGGLCFMVNDKMCVGVEKNKLMARLDPDIYEYALSKKGCREMDFTGRPMRGFVFVEPVGIQKEEDLDYWVQLCLDFNPKARSSKKKKK
ncbi:MAG: TfoX/Sxy family protein [Melioribacteraceae bacterium]|nr:TfoX/Sxy family protein [Melioribacteraceae bacterium]